MPKNRNTEIPQIGGKLRSHILRMPEAVFAVYPYTPPTTQELFSERMATYRDEQK